VRLAELRRLVSIEQLLQHRGLLDGLSRRGHRLIGPCPIHGGDNPTAFVVDCRRELWNCHTRCRGGDAVELLRALDGLSYAQVARTLGALQGRAIARPATPRAPPERFRPYTTTLALDPEHPFLAARGIRADTAQRFEVGAWHGRGMLAGCVAARLHDPDGQPLGYTGRRLHPDHRGKWVLPRGLPKARLLYGWHRASRRQPLVVVEGPWEVLRLQQIGVPAVALLGTHASDEQLRLLQARPCLILLDGDDAGRSAAAVLAGRLGAPALSPPPELDPADLTDHQLARLLRSSSSP